VKLEFGTTFIKRLMRARKDDLPENETQKLTAQDGPIRTSAEGTCSWGTSWGRIRGADLAKKSLEEADKTVDRTPWILLKYPAKRNW